MFFDAHSILLSISTCVQTATFNTPNKCQGIPRLAHQTELFFFRPGGHHWCKLLKIFFVIYMCIFSCQPYLVVVYGFENIGMHIFFYFACEHALPFSSGGGGVVWKPNPWVPYLTFELPGKIKTMNPKICVVPYVNVI